MCKENPKSTIFIVDEIISRFRNMGKNRITVWKWVKIILLFNCIQYFSGWFINQMRKQHLQPGQDFLLN